jgi:choline kinase
MGEFYPYDEDTVGLRIMYGALKSMGVIDQTWYDFLEIFADINFLKLTASNAVKLLQRLFGEKRRIYIGVDEISKAKDSNKVMTEIGAVLSNYEGADVLVSALSPEVIRLLTSESQRPAEYCPLRPLLFEYLGFFFIIINNNNNDNK